VLCSKNIIRNFIPMVKMFSNTTNTVILMTLGYLRIKKKSPNNNKEIYNDKYYSV
jgi:hypothetical protein